MHEGKQQRDAADMAGTPTGSGNEPEAMQCRRPTREVFGLTLLLLTAARLRGVPWVLTNLPCKWWPVAKSDGVRIRHGEMLMEIGRLLETRSRKFPFRLIPRLKRNLCLAKALLAAWYSCKMGFPISLHFGVRISADGILKGHSWVTLPSGTIWRDDTFAEISHWRSDGSGRMVASCANTVERGQ